MPTAHTQKVLTDLQFYIWRIKFEPNENWHPEIFVMGSDSALQTMREAMMTMKEEYQQYGECTRKILCNPPEDIDVVRYAKENRAELEWLIWLIIQMKAKTADDARFEIKNKAVIIQLNEYTLGRYLQILQNRVESSTQQLHGQSAPCGLFFTTDWLGADRKL